MPAGSQLYAPHAVPRPDRYLVRAEEYASFNRQGFLVVRSAFNTFKVNQ